MGNKCGGCSDNTSAEDDVVLAGALKKAAQRRLDDRQAPTQSQTQETQLAGDLHRISHTKSAPSPPGEMPEPTRPASEDLIDRDLHRISQQFESPRSSTEPTAILPEPAPAVVEPKPVVSATAQAPETTAVQDPGNTEESFQQPVRRPIAGRRTITWARCHGTDFGTWAEAIPMTHRAPDAVRVTHKRQALREAPKYPGSKINDSYCELGSELAVVEHQVFAYKEIRINCYRVNDGGVDGWLLDYSPGEDLTMLEIKYDERWDDHEHLAQA